MTDVTIAGLPVAASVLDSNLIIAEAIGTPNITRRATAAQMRAPLLPLDGTRPMSGTLTISSGGAKITGDVIDNGRMRIGSAAAPVRMLDITALPAADTGNQARITGYQASWEMFNQAQTQNWYIGVNDADSNALYIGRGYSAGQGVSPSIKITTADGLTFASGFAANGNSSVVGTFTVSGNHNITTGDGTNSFVAQGNGETIQVLTGANATFCLFRTVSAGSVGSIAGDGAGGVTYGSISDRRKKRIVGPSDGRLIDAIKVYEAAFLAMPDAVYPMLIADELQQVAPFAAFGEANAVDEHGDAVPQMVDHSRLVPALIARLQAAIAEIATLKGRLDTANIP